MAKLVAPLLCFLPFHWEDKTSSSKAHLREAKRIPWCEFVGAFCFVLPHSFLLLLIHMVSVISVFLRLRQMMKLFSNLFSLPDISWSNLHTGCLQGCLKKLAIFPLLMYGMVWYLRLHGVFFYHSRSAVFHSGSPNGFLDMCARLSQSAPGVCVVKIYDDF